MSYPGIFHDAPYLPHSDNKLGALILAEVKRKFSKEVRDSKEIKEVRERNNFVCIRI